MSAFIQLLHSLQVCSSTTNLKTLPAAVSSIRSDTSLPRVKKNWKDLLPAPGYGLGAASHPHFPVPCRGAVLGPSLGTHPPPNTGLFESTHTHTHEEGICRALARKQVRSPEPKTCTLKHFHLNSKSKGKFPFGGVVNYRSLLQKLLLFLSLLTPPQMGKIRKALPSPKSNKSSVLPELIHLAKL